MDDSYRSFRRGDREPPPLTPRRRVGVGGEKRRNHHMSTTETRPERGRLLKSRKAVATCVALAGVAAASLVAGASNATAANAYERGPAPTAAGLETTGPY